MSAKRQQSFDGERFLVEHPVFTLEQLRQAMRKRTPDSAREWVKYHARVGRVRSIERALYASVPPGTPNPAEYVPDRFLVASAVRPEGIIAYHGALELLGVAHSVWREVVVQTERRRKRIRLNAWTVDFQLIPGPLRTRTKKTLGTTPVPYRNHQLHVTGPERTVVEGFRIPRLVGGLPELVESAAGFPTLDLDLLETILRTYNQKAVFAGVGWFLEQYQRTFYVPDDFLSSLARRRPRSTLYLPREQRMKGGHYVKRWNLVLPESVVQIAESNAG